MELIQTVTVGSGGASTIEFSTIPTTYDDLCILISSRNSANFNDNEIIRLRFNNDSTAGNYAWRSLIGTGSSAVSTSSGSSPTNTHAIAGRSPSALRTANTFDNNFVYIPNYRSSTAKSISTDAVEEANQTAVLTSIFASTYSGTAAISTITLSLETASFLQHSSASLYGIRKFNTSAQPKATGGAISFDAVNNKWVHVFTASGTFTPNTNLTDVEYLVIAGGGGGGADAGGGGGAGGYRSSVVGQSSGGGASAEARLSISSGSAQTVTVGAGGTSGGSSANPTSGNNSVFGSITATGGGFGHDFGIAAASGGSGGGANGVFGNTTPGSGTTGQGYAGGSGSGSFITSAGGGGAGSVGANVTALVGAAGGSGVASNITGTSVTRAGGGGGGGSGQSGGTSGGAGGSGGGGKGQGSDGVAVAGSPNTGGGGGGAHSGAGSTALGAAGGSGIVIVRYDA